MPSDNESNCFVILIVLGSSDFEGNRPLVVNKKSGLSLFDIGFYDGVFGPGPGTLMMYVLSHIGVSYIRAVGLARIAIFSSCFGASITYIATGNWCANRSSSCPKIKKGIRKAFTANRHHRINHSNCCF